VYRSCRPKPSSRCRPCCGMPEGTREVSVSLVNPRCCHAGSPSFGSATRSESLAAYSTVRMGLDDPTLPLAIPSAVWFSCKQLGWLRLSRQSNPLSSFASV
jgi:hypothetical protein